MAIVNTDLIFRLSIPSAAAGDVDPQPDPDDSLGAYVSTTAVNLAAPANNLFDNVRGIESEAGDTEYRCVFILNNHATLTAEDVRVYISAETDPGADVAIGLDPTGITAKGKNDGVQAVAVADEDTAPAGVAFSSPVDYATALTIGNLAPGEVAAVWIRRTVAAATPALDVDGVVLTVAVDSAA